MTLYVSSVDGNDVDDGSTWALAKATGDGALQVAVAGEDVYFDSAHLHDYGAGETYPAVAGSNANPVRFWSVDRSGNPEPPTVLLPGAKESSTAAFIVMSATSGLIVTDMSIEAGNDITLSAADTYFKAIGGKIIQASLSGGRDIETPGDDRFVSLEGVELSFGHAAQAINVTGAGRVNLIGCYLAPGSAAINYLLGAAGSRASLIVTSACELSGMAPGAALIGLLPASLPQGQGYTYTGSGNRLPANGTINSASFVEHGTRIEIYDTANDTSAVPGVYVQDLRGLTSQDTGVYRDADYDGTNGYSYKTTATVNGTAVLPHRVKIWERGLTAADPTLTVQLLTDGAVTFNAADAWIEFEFPTVGSAGDTIISTVDPNFGLGTPATLAAGVGTGAWTAPPAGSTSYQIQQAITGGRTGVHRAFLNFAPGVAEAIFTDPSVDVT